MISFPFFKSHLLYLLLFLFLTGTFVYAQNEPSTLGDGSAVIKRYQTSDNAIDRRYALNDLKALSGHATPRWASDLLKTALNDNDPIVVEEAIFQIGNLRMADFSPELTAMYNNAEKRFLGYSIRLQYAIISTLGKIGGTSSKEFIAQLLRTDNGSDYGEFILMAIKDLNTKELVSDVAAYAVKMKKIVEKAKAKNLDPLLYSRKLWYIQVASEVQDALLLKGGN